MPKKLSATQSKAMALMSKGWSANQAYGSAVCINGERVCNINTILALESRGLVERKSTWVWRATEAGRQWVAEVRT